MKIRTMVALTLAALGLSIGGPIACSKVKNPVIQVSHRPIYGTGGHGFTETTDGKVTLAVITDNQYQVKEYSTDGQSWVKGSAPEIDNKMPYLLCRGADKCNIRVAPVKDPEGTSGFDGYALTFANEAGFLKTKILFSKDKKEFVKEEVRSDDGSPCSVITIIAVDKDRKYSDVRPFWTGNRVGRDGKNYDERLQVIRPDHKIALDRQAELEFFLPK